MPEDHGQEVRQQRLLFTLASTGLEMVSPLVIGAILDWYLGWTPWLTITGLVVGSVSAISHMVLLANKEDREAGGHKPSKGASP
jgi:F0F1-type ATP synthase assembly protein I